MCLRGVEMCIQGGLQGSGWPACISVPRVRAIK